MRDILRRVSRIENVVQGKDDFSSLVFAWADGKAWPKDGPIGPVDFSPGVNSLSLIPELKYAEPVNALTKIDAEIDACITDLHKEGYSWTDIREMVAPKQPDPKEEDPEREYDEITLLCGKGRKRFDIENG